MNPEIKQRWIEDLNSDEYKKTKKHLKDSTGFCCLGVLTNLYITEHNQEWNLYNDCYYTFDGLYGSLSSDVMNWAGIDAPWGNLKEPVGEFDTLAGLNDNGYSFKQIAQVIEEQL